LLTVVSNILFVIGGNIMKKWEVPKIKKLDIKQTEMRPGNGYGRTHSNWKWGRD